MVQNDDYIELVDALKCLRDNDIAHLPQSQKDILLNADEKDLIQAYYDMDGEFSCSKCCNTENPYLSIPLALCCCATSVAMIGGVCAGIYLAGSEYGGIGALGHCSEIAVLPVLPAKYALDLVKKTSKVQDEVPHMEERHVNDDLALNDIHDLHQVVRGADNIFLKYLKDVCSLHTYTATDKMYIEGLIQQLCSAKKMRHSNNLDANINLSASDDIHIH